MAKELLMKYKEYEGKYAAYRLALTTLTYDRETIAPKNGADFRNNHIGILMGEVFSYQTAPENIELLVELDKISDELPFDIARSVKYNLRNLETIRFVPKDLYIEYQQAIAHAGTLWQQAKEADNYELFKPSLLNVIYLTKKVNSYRPSKDKTYNLLLDDYEMGMTMEKYDEFFQQIKDKLIPLIKEITAKEPLEDSFLFQNYDINKQREFMKVIMEYCNFDLDSGYLAESAHPFSISLSINDNRITTSYIENMVDSGILSTIHELGHATYFGQVDTKYDGTIIADYMSFGMHESQSRLFENYLGRSEAFWTLNYPKLQELFPNQLKEVSLQQFVAALNASKPSFIRTEADELTYPLHVLIRYEIEKAIFNEEIDLDNLEEIWNDKYEEYLGIRPTSAKVGILQDVHWSQGSFGYFPTYALGSAYSAQWMKIMQQDLDVEEALRTNNFKLIKDWLKENIHQYGGLYSPEEMLVRVTKETFNPQYYIDYLTTKYRKLYNLD